MRIIFVVPIIALIVATKSMAFNTWDFASGENKSVIERIAGARGDTI